MHEVVVDELTGGFVPHDDARAESRCDREQHGRGGSEFLWRQVELPVHKRRDVADEPVSTTGDGLEQARVDAKRNANLSYREVDALIVRDLSIGPERGPDLFAGHQVTCVFEQERQQLRRLRLQVAQHLTPAQT